MSDAVEIAAGAVHAGCHHCDGAGTVTDDMGGGYASMYQCESLAQLEDVLTQAFEALHEAGWRIVKLATYSGVEPPYITEEWAP